MKHFLTLALGTALAVSGCGTPAPKATDTALSSTATATSTSTAAPAAAAPETVSSAPVSTTPPANGSAKTTPAPAAKAAAVTQPATPARPAAPVQAAFREVTIPAGTSLPLSLTSAIASDTSAIEDAVSAELTRAIVVDGREVIPAGTPVTGHVTAVDGAGRVKGRAMIEFRFTSLRAGNTGYDVQAAPISQLAPATKGEDATKVGVGAGAGALIGGLLGGKGGAAKGAAIGGGAGAGVVLATKGQEIRLATGADVSTALTAPLTIRVRAQ